jgi:nucleotide-binding universal stress UspA family protein
MTIKSILCVFGGLESELNALNTTFVLGEAYGAHVRILHISPHPAAYAGIYGEGVYATPIIVEAVEKENTERMQKAKQYVTSFAAKHHIPLDAPESPAHHASAKFLHLTELAETAIAHEGRLSDLIVMSRYEELAGDTITPALFNTGRPVLIVPLANDGLSSQWHDKTVALAWNGSQQSARALYNALSMLGRTEKLYVLTVEKPGREYLAAEAALMEYLRAHGIHAQGIIVAAGNQSTGEALLKRANDLHADFLVMGAYGHSMFREMVLGGVTEHMLKKADIPILLSH